MSSEAVEIRPRAVTDASGAVDGVRGALVCAALVGTAAVYSVRMETFLDAKGAVLGVLLACAGLLVLLRGRLPWACVWAYGLLAAYFGVALALQGLREDARLLDFPYENGPQIVALAFAIASYDLFRDPGWRRRFAGAIMWSGVLVSLAAIVQVTNAAPAWFPAYGGKAQPVYSVFGNSNLLGAYLALVAPLFVWKLCSGMREGSETDARRTGLGAWFVHAAALTLIVVALGLAGSRGAWAATCVGCIVALGARGVTPRRVFVLGLIAPLAVFAAVYAAPERTLDKVAHTMSPADSGGTLRLWFWEGTCRMVRDHWLVGTGLGSFAYYSPRYMGEALWAQGGERLAHNELLVEHPHCEPLLILAETGVTGALFWAAIGVVLLKRRGPEWGALAALAVVACVSFPFRSPPHALAGLVLAGMLTARSGEHVPGSWGPRLTRPSGVCAGLVGVVAVVAGAAYVGLVTPGSFLLRHAQDVHLSGTPPFEAYERALAWPLQRAVAHENYGLALLQAGRREEARRQYEEALRGIDTGAVHLALAILASERHEGPTAYGHFDAVVWRWPRNETAWRGLIAGSIGESRQSTLDLARRWLGEETVRRLEAGATDQGSTRGRSTP